VDTVAARSRRRATPLAAESLRPRSKALIKAALSAGHENVA
jgi:hypothetical protein